MFDFPIPDPASIIEGIINGKIEREIGKSLLSQVYSAQIAFLWRTGANKKGFMGWFGEGQAFQDMATVMYLSLQPLVKDKTFSLAVPKELLSPDNLAKFQTEFEAGI